MRQSKWLMLALAALANFAAYYTYDSIAPVAEALHRLLGLSQRQIGLLNAVYSLPNIPLALIGGVLIDRIGAARAALIASALCLAGAAMTAMGTPYDLMLLGRLVFGTGSETLYIALLVAIARWFGAGGGALATSLFFSIARVGSYLADISPRWAAGLYAQGWQAPLWLACAVCAGGLLAALACFRLDGDGPHSRDARHGVLPRLGELAGFGSGFWQILWLNVLFASVFFPFRSTFAIQYFQQVHHLTLAAAGTMNSWVFFAAIPATPLCGLLADRFGHRASLLAFAAVLLPLNFGLLGANLTSLWLSTALMGVSFSVIPAVIWPATALMVPRERLGAAYGLINMVQSLGLVVSNYMAGWLNDTFAASAAHPAGYIPMFGWFVGLGTIAAGCALMLLWHERRGTGHGLEAAGDQGSPALN